MEAFRIERLWTFLCSLNRFMLFLLVGAVVLSITLVVLLWTRWGHSHSLEKCVVLSIIAHALLTGYAATVQITGFRMASREEFIRVALVDGPPGAERGRADGTDPTAGSPVAKVPPLAAIPADKDLAAVKTAASTVLPNQPETGWKPILPPKPLVETTAKPQVTEPAATQKTLQLAAATTTASGWKVADAAEKCLQDFSTAGAAELDKAIAALNSMPPAPAVAPTAAIVAKPPATAASQASGDAAMAAEVAAAVAGAKPMPETYKLRIAGDHVGAARAGGGSPQTEAAVQAALKWLAEHQGEDGRWEARRNEAGRGTAPDGQSRPNAGADADTGMTGLALLALLGNGHTHLRGDYRDNVRRGLNFLLRSQDSAGCLSGTADRYAAMYCHAIATFALGEAYGMTGERRLEQPLRRAIDYTIAVQDPYNGGLALQAPRRGRYQPTRLAVHGLEERRNGGNPRPGNDPAGRHSLPSIRGIRRQRRPGILSAAGTTQPYDYRRGHALLALPRHCPRSSSLRRSGGFFADALPGVGQTDFYYWYYGTFLMHQFQGDGWQRWNSAVSTR